MPKSKPLLGYLPDWYRFRSAKSFGDYFGSLCSLSAGETYLTYDRKYIVHRKPEGIVSVRSNKCAHAGALLLTEPGVQNPGQIRCPIHKWGYKPSGELIGAPSFVECKDITLTAPEFGLWNGYVLGFTQKELNCSSLTTFGETLKLPQKAFAPEEFVFMGEDVDPLPYPRDLMYVNYFDGYHVPHYHKRTFAAVADCETYEWEIPEITGNRVCHNIQQVRARSDIKKHTEWLARTENLPREAFGWADLHLWLQEVIPDVERPIDKDIFAVWAAIYGNGYLMPELYEGGLFLAVSYLVSLDCGDGGLLHRIESSYDAKSGEWKYEIKPNQFNLVEYYVHKSIPEEHRLHAYRKFKSAYGQSAREDDEICMRLWDAHRLGGADFKRIYHEVLEAGDPHWREWYFQHFSK